jgi:tetratricopeptide (TPR) repeat protein
MERDDQRLGKELFGPALDLAREIGDRQSTALALYSLGVLAFNAGEIETAEAFQLESASITHEAGGLPEPHALVVLGMIRQIRGDAAGAKSLLLEGLEEYRAYGDQLGLAEALRSLGGVALDEGELAVARSQLREALAIHHALGEPASVIASLEELAGVMQASADPLDAARLFGAVQGLRDATGYSLKIVEQRRHDRHFAAARDAMNDATAFDRAWSEGRSWTLDEAVRFAQGV